MATILSQPVTALSEAERIGQCSNLRIDHRRRDGGLIAANKTPEGFRISLGYRFFFRPPSSELTDTSVGDRYHDAAAQKLTYLSETNPSVIWDFDVAANFAHVDAVIILHAFVNCDAE